MRDVTYLLFVIRQLLKHALLKISTFIFYTTVNQNINSSTKRCYYIFYVGAIYHYVETKGPT